MSANDIMRGVSRTASGWNNKNEHIINLVPPSIPLSPPSLHAGREHMDVFFSHGDRERGIADAVARTEFAHAVFTGAPPNVGAATGIVLGVPSRPLFGQACRVKFMGNDCRAINAATLAMAWVRRTTGETEGCSLEQAAGVAGPDAPANCANWSSLRQSWPSYRITTGSGPKLVTRP